MTKGVVLFHFHIIYFGFIFKRIVTLPYTYLAVGTHSVGICLISDKVTNIWSSTVASVFFLFIRFLPKQFYASFFFTFDVFQFRCIVPFVKPANVNLLTSTHPRLFIRFVLKKCQTSSIKTENHQQLLAPMVLESYFTLKGNIIERKLKFN